MVGVEKKFQHGMGVVHERWLGWLPCSGTHCRDCRNRAFEIVFYPPSRSSPVDYLCGPVEQEFEVIFLQ